MIKLKPRIPDLPESDVSWLKANWNVLKRSDANDTFSTLHTTTDHQDDRQQGIPHLENLC